MLGQRLAECMMLRKSEIFLFESYFRRSILKSPSNITTFVSLINFSERGLRYSSLKSHNNTPSLADSVGTCSML